MEETLNEAEVVSCGRERRKHDVVMVLCLFRIGGRVSGGDLFVV